MKPDWKDAPEWAEWLYPSSIGTWVWSSSKPKWSWLSGVWKETGIYDAAQEQIGEARFPRVSRLRQALERRPQTTKPAEAGSEGQGA